MPPKKNIIRNQKSTPVVNVDALSQEDKLAFAQSPIDSTGQMSIPTQAVGDSTPVNPLLSRQYERVITEDGFVDDQLQADELELLSSIETGADISDEIYEWKRFDADKLKIRFVQLAKAAYVTMNTGTRFSEEYGAYLGVGGFTPANVLRLDITLITKYVLRAGLNTDKFANWCEQNKFPNLRDRYKIQIRAKDDLTMTMSRISMINPDLTVNISGNTRDLMLKTFSESLGLVYSKLPFMSLCMVHYSCDNSKFKKFVKHFLIYKSIVTFNKNSENQQTLLQVIAKQINVMDTFASFNLNLVQVDKIYFDSDIEDSKYESVINSAVENKASGDAVSMFSESLIEKLKKVKSKGK